MAEFQTTTGASAALEQIVTQARERLVLISPYLRINQRLKDLIEDSARFKIDIRVVYGKTDLRQDQNDWLASQPEIRVSYCENLHAKCYMNEQTALLTSMNLYEYSQVVNIEMGVLVNRDQDISLYDSIHHEAQRILRMSETRPSPPAAELANPLRGFCIRCRGDLPANPEKPYCSSCFKSWNRYKNDKYAEKHCHRCGSPNASTLRSPICGNCSAVPPSRPKIDNRRPAKQGFRPGRRQRA